MMTETEKIAAEQFWSWFEKNRLPYEFTDSMSQEQLADAFEKLEQAIAPYCESLKPNVTRKVHEDETFKLIVSAGGNRQFFEEARAIIDLAPEIPGWEFIALVPPLPREVRIRFDLGPEILDPNDLYFRLLGVEELPNNLGIQVILKLYNLYEDDPESLENLRDVVTNLIAYIIGEESFAMDIQYLEIGPLIPAPLEMSYAQLYDLPDYIAEFRKNHPSPHLE